MSNEKISFVENFSAVGETRIGFFLTQNNKESQRWADINSKKKTPNFSYNGNLI